VVLKALANANRFFTVDIDSVDGNCDVTCPKVADGEHFVQVQTAVANILNKQQALSSDSARDNTTSLLKRLETVHSVSNSIICSLIGYLRNGNNGVKIRETAI